MWFWTEAKYSNIQSNAVQLVFIASELDIHFQGNLKVIFCVLVKQIKNQIPIKLQRFAIEYNFFDFLVGDFEVHLKLNKF